MYDMQIKYYGINDLATLWEIKSLIEEKIDNDDFVNWVECTIKSSIETLESYVDNLKVKALLNYEEVIPYLNIEEHKVKLENFFQKIKKNGTIKDIEIKIIKYINISFKEILDYNDKILISETLDLILDNKGFKEWKTLLNNIDCVLYLGFNCFDKVYKVLHKIDKELNRDFIEKVLFPLKIHCGLEKQLDIIKRINQSYSDIAKKYEVMIMDYIRSDAFSKIDCYEKNNIINKMLNSKFFSNKNEIILTNIYEKVTNECDKKINKNGDVITITSDNYMNFIKSIDNIEEKLELLLFDNRLSYFEMMMNESKEICLFDLISYNGISKNKYKNSTLRNIKLIKSQIIVNTVSLLINNKSDFWLGMHDFSKKVTEFIHISNFLSEDLDDIRFLLENKRYFIAATLLSQVIERLLREVYFKLEYGITGFLKSSNFTLGTLLTNNKENNSLMNLFKKNELEALNFFLNDRENGENIRNSIAHYIINKRDIKEADVIFLIDILLFILISIKNKSDIFKRF